MWLDKCCLLAFVAGIFILFYCVKVYLLACVAEIAMLFACVARNLVLLACVARYHHIITTIIIKSSPLIIIM